MMQPKSPRELEDERRLAERAAEWWSVLKTAGPAEREEFAAWIAESPRHLEEFLYTTAVVQEIRHVDIERLPAVKAMLVTAPVNVIHLSPHAVSDEPAPSDLSETAAEPRIHRSSRRPWAWAASLIAVATLAATAYWSYRSNWQTYATSVAEQRSFELPDRSVIHLNGRTRLQVHLSTETRDIRLLDGEAMFKVEHDPTRPFRVHSNGTIIQAIGTQFNVRRQGFGTTVAVIEGAVQVSKEKLTAGQEARIGHDGLIERRIPVDIATVSAWRQHRLIFRADTLTDVATEFNRYNRTPQIIIEGDVSRARRYSGVFDADDPRSLMEFLRGDAELDLEERDDRIVIRVR
jgi:transmembrane sensor